MTQTPEERARLIAPYTEISRQRRDELTKQIAAAIRAAVAAERERCLDACQAESRVYSTSHTWLEACASCARAIREAPPPQETQT